MKNQILDSIELKPFTKNTIIDRKALELELEKTKEKGWAVDNEEHETGVCCIAAPVLDFTGKVIAAISISGDKSSINYGQNNCFIKLVIDAAKDISKRMGYIKQT